MDRSPVWSRPVDEGTFVGRGAELAVLASAWAHALEGRSRLVLLTGDAGIGKTRLVEALRASVARDRGRTLVGRTFDGEDAPAYWPWVQVVATLAQDPEYAEMVRAAPAAAAELAMLVPDGPPVDAAARPGTGDPAIARFQLFDAMAQLLTRAAAPRGLLVAIEDLHAADEPTCRLLHFLARHADGARWLLVATCRTSGLDETTPAGRLIGEMLREPGAQQLRLQGLSEDEVQAMVAAEVSGDVPRPVWRSLAQATDGHPLWIVEALRLFADEGLIHAGRWLGGQVVGDVPIPSTLRSVIGSNLARLPDETRELLGVAAVIGRVFSRRLVAEVAGDATAVGSALRVAQAERLVSASLDDPDTYTFAHALIQGALYDELPAGDRRTLHRRVRDALERSESGDPETLSALARHATAAAASPAEWDRAMAHARRVADRALGLLAYEEAARLYGLAMDAASQARPDDLLLRHELAMSLAIARRGAGDPTSASVAYGEAARLAEALGNIERFAEAVIGYAQVAVSTNVQLDEVIRLLERALASVPPGDGRLRARLLAGHGSAISFTDQQRGLAMQREAVAMAERLADVPLLAETITALCWGSMGSGYAGDLDQPARRLWAVAEQVGSAELQLLARAYAGVDALVDGDLAALDSALADVARLADGIRAPFYHYAPTFIRAARAMHVGDYARAELLAERARAIGRRGDLIDAERVYSVQLFEIRLAQGRVGEVEEAVRAMTLAEPRSRMNRRAMLARLQVEDGREHEAAAALPRMVVDLPTVRHFAFWLPCAVMLAEVAFAVGDAGAAGTLYEQLLPFAARNVSLGAGVLSRGVVAERLGLLATVTGAVDQAIVHFEEALRRNARNGALPALARTQIAYAQVLLEHGDPSARDRAQQLLADGLVTARRLGMAGRVGKALARRDGAGGAVVTLRVQVEDDRLWGAVKREAAATGGLALRTVGPELLLVFGDERAARGCEAGLLELLARKHGTRGRPRAGLRIVLDTGEAARMIVRDTGGTEAPEANVMRREGNLWAITYEGTTIRSRHGRGLQYLAELVATPGRYVHVLELTGGAQLSDGSPTPALDARAKAEYRARVGDLEAELEEARRNNDAERAEGIAREIDALTGALAEALGFAGRDRRHGRASERARSAVTMRIRGTIRQLSEQHPALGRHLDLSVRTGALCAYVVSAGRPALQVR